MTAFPLRRDLASSVSRLVLTAMLLASALFTAQLGVPTLSVACSCMRPGNVAEVRGDPDVIVVAGTIVSLERANPPFADQPLGQFAVQRLYQGPNLPGRVGITGGDGANCIPTIEAGWQVVMTANVVAGRLVPVGCGHFGILTTPEGQDLLRDVQAAFGQGAGPGGPPDVDLAANPQPDLGLVAIALVTFVVGLTAAAAVLAFGRRRDPPTDPPTDPPADPPTDPPADPT